MSRALRKAQRQKLEALAAAEDINDAQSGSSEEEDVAVGSTKPVLNPFDLLDAAGVEDVAAEHSDRSSELATDEEADLQAALDASLTQAKTAPSVKKPKKKKKKAAKKHKAVCTEDDRDDNDDEFEAVLAAHQEALKTIEAPETAHKAFNLVELLSIDVKMLDPNVEMRRLFGSKVVASERTERTSMNRRNLPRGMQQLSRGRKSILVPMEDNYPLTIKGGLEMTMEEDLDGIKTFRFVHSKSYQQTQFTFMQCVQSGDPQTLMNLLTRAPFHVDTLLQVSEILRHQGDNEQSGEMLTRALFAFDRAFHPLFNIASGLVRLPFEFPENRPFYLAIYRYIQSLGRRGCWATAFEFNKLLYALAPEEDPYAALLSIDFYAIKARNWKYITKLSECPWHLVLDDDFPKPNFEYAKALGKAVSTFSQGVSPEAITAMGQAVKHFPYVVGPLFNELKAAGPIQFDNLEPGSQLGDLMRDLYVFRAKDVYNTPELTKFLRDASLPIESFEPIQFSSNDIPTNVCRHILLLDERTLLHYLPKAVTSAPGMSFDPLPPGDSLPSYLDAYLPSGGPNTAALGGSTTMIPQFIQDLLRRILPNHNLDEAMNDEQVARLMQEMEIQEPGAWDNEDEDGQGTRHGEQQHDVVDEYADPNGYGPNRGVDEPDQEGNAGRR